MRCGVIWKITVMLFLLFSVCGCAQNEGLAEKPPLGATWGTVWVVKNDNSLWYWGSTRYVLDREPGDAILSPRKIAEDVAEAVFNNRSLLLLKTNGDLYERDEWENPDTERKMMNNVRQIAGGRYHSLVLENNGNLWAYDDAESQENGDDGADIENIANMNSPQMIMEGVSSVTACWSSSFAVKADGTLWSWGSNEYGQLGDGTTDDALTPVKIMDDVKSVTGGLYHVMALKNDESLWAWGDNVVGQSGQGEEKILKPQQVMSDVKYASASVRGSVAVKNDGTLWVWGITTDKDNNASAWPVNDVPEQKMDGVIYAVSGMACTYVIKEDGSLWDWGANFSGQLGDGTKEKRSIPMKVMSGIRLPH